MQMEPFRDCGATTRRSLQSLAAPSAGQSVVVAPRSFTELFEKLERIHPFAAFGFFHGRIQIGKELRILDVDSFLLSFDWPFAHDALNGTSAAGETLFANSLVSHRFVIFSTTVFWRSLARRLVKSTSSRCWS